MEELIIKFSDSKLYMDYKELKDIWREIYTIIHNLKKINKSNEDILKSYNSNDIERLYNYLSFCIKNACDTYYILATRLESGIVPTINKIIDDYEVYDRKPISTDELIETIFLTDINHIDNTIYMVWYINNYIRDVKKLDDYYSVYKKSKICKN